MVTFVCARPPALTFPEQTVQRGCSARCSAGAAPRWMCVCAPRRPPRRRGIPGSKQPGDWPDGHRAGTARAAMAAVIARPYDVWPGPAHPGLFVYTHAHTHADRTPPWRLRRSRGSNGCDFRPPLPPPPPPRRGVVCHVYVKTDTVGHRRRRTGASPGREERRPAPAAPPSRAPRPASIRVRSDTDSERPDLRRRSARTFPLRDSAKGKTRRVHTLYTVWLQAAALLIDTHTHTHTVLYCHTPSVQRYFSVSFPETAWRKTVFPGTHPLGLIPA